MTTASPYLFFDGNCREAMNFYKGCFGGSLEVMTYGDSDPSAMAAIKDKIMHSFLSKGAFGLMGSDSYESKPLLGENVQIGIGCDTVPEIEALFKALSEKGKVDYPLADAPWGAKFGSLTDRYGVKWLLNCETGKK